MQLEDVNINNLTGQFKDFSIQGFNIFGTGEDGLPHLVCVCPNRSFARAIQSLLTSAKQTKLLQELNATVSSNCRPDVPEEATPLNESAALLYVYEDTLLHPRDGEEEFPC